MAQPFTKVTMLLDDVCCFFGLCRTRNLDIKWYDGWKFYKSRWYGECRLCGRKYRVSQ